MEQAFKLIDARKWEMTRLIHQDELADEHKLGAFLDAVKSGEFKGLAVPSLDVFPMPVLDALAELGVELGVYDPAAVERARVANEVLAKQESRKGAKQPPKVNYEKLAENEPWKAALLNAFLKKDE
ncbi:MAG: hypothetical protein JWM80_3447 [Cyanobacteria bacterium RYN_339]|nr:hypothetical protein [Cyanobacteria bacterium RYN_339]